MIKRLLNLRQAIEINSYFLFGPRATGKTSLIEATIKADLSLNLLSPKEYLRYTSQPGLLTDQCADLKSGALIVIDEVQRIPDLLNEVHYLIEKKKLRFLLTGSSARKLKSGKANLLAGEPGGRSYFRWFLMRFLTSTSLLI